MMSTCNLYPDTRIHSVEPLYAGYEYLTWGERYLTWCERYLTLGKSANILLNLLLSTLLANRLDEI